MKGKQIDIGKSINFFFSLKDWQHRVLLIGGTFAVLMFADIVLSFVGIIPFIGWIISLLGSFGFLIAIMLLQAYLEGYKFEILSAVVEGKNPETVRVDTRYKERIKTGTKIYLGYFIYMLPVIIVGSTAFLLLLLPLITLSVNSSLDTTSKSSAGAASMLAFTTSTIGFYVVIIIVAVLASLVQYLIYPAMIAQFYKKQTIGSMLKIGEIFRFVKQNAVNILLFFALNLIVGMVMGVVYIIAAFSLFLCVGFILLPIVWAVSVVYATHLQAHALGQMIKNQK